MGLGSTSTARLMVIAEKFKETFFRQYKEEVTEMLLESTHKLGVDWDEFNFKLARTWDAAKVDGLGPQDFEQILYEVCPSHMNQVDFSYLTPYKSAA